MISVRISEAEYEALKTHHRNYGARNVSDLTRLALRQILEQPPNHPDIAASLAAFGDRLDRLESQVSLLLERENASV